VIGRPPKVSLPRQFGILSRRYLDLIIQDRRNLLILLLQAPIIGILLMLVVKQSKPRIWLLGDKADQKSANPDVLESA